MTGDRTQEGVALTRLLWLRCNADEKGDDARYTQLSKLIDLWREVFPEECAAEREFWRAQAGLK